MEERSAPDVTGYSRESPLSLRFLILEALRILKFFYSFKDLEETLGIPAQVLWRYTTLKSIPEKGTAEKLWRKIVEGGVFTAAFEKAAATQGRGSRWYGLSNPGLPMLAGFTVAIAYRKHRVSSVLSFPDSYSAVFSAGVAYYLKAKLCLTSGEPLAENPVVVTYVSETGAIRAIGVGRDCIAKNSKILITAFRVPSCRQLEALYKLARKCYANPVGVVVLAGDTDCTIGGEGVGPAVVPVRRLIETIASIRIS